MNILKELLKEIFNFPMNINEIKKEKIINAKSRDKIIHLGTMPNLLNFDCITLTNIEALLI